MADLKGRYEEEPRAWQATEAPATLGEVWDASRTLQAIDNSNANDVRLEETYAPLLDAVNAQRRREGLPEMSNPVHGIRTIDPRAADRSGSAYSRAGLASVGQLAAQRDFYAELARIRRTSPDFLTEAGNDPAALMQRSVEREKIKRAVARNTIDRSEGLASGLTWFGGAAGKAMEDPVNFWGTAIGGGGARSLVGVAARQFAINAALTAVGQPQAAANRAVVGEELTAMEALTNIGISGVAGAAIGTAVQGAAPVLGRAWDGTMAGIYTSLPERLQTRWRDAATLPDDAISDIVSATIPQDRITPDLRAALKVLDDNAWTEGTSPFAAGIGNSSAHGERLAAALRRASEPEMAVSRRARLNAGTTLAAGDFGGRGAGAATGESGMAAYMRAVRGAESSGNDAAAARTSSAYGRYQFTRGTWLRYYVRAFGRQGLSDADILATRANGQTQDVLMQALTADNAAALRNAGHEPSAVNLYLMHFAGPGDGVRVLDAASATPVRELLNAKSVAANAWLRDLTAGELRARLARKVDGRAKPASRAETAADIEPAVRADGEAAPPATVEGPLAEPSPTRVADYLTTNARTVRPKELVELIDDTAMRAILIAPDGKLHVLDGVDHNAFGAAAGDEATGYAAITGFGNELALRRAAVPSPAQERIINQLRARSEQAGKSVTEGGVVGDVGVAYPVVRPSPEPGATPAGAGTAAGTGDAAPSVATEPGTATDTPGGAAIDGQPSGDDITPALFDDYEDVAPLLGGQDARDIADRAGRLDADDPIWGAIDRHEAERAMASISDGGEADVATMRAFDEPFGAGSEAQRASLLHDARMMLTRETGVEVRIDADGDARPLADVIAEIDAERAMIERVKSCL